MSFNDQLYDAYRSEDYQKISDVLEKMTPEEVNEKNEDGCGETVLHMAILNNRDVSPLLNKPGIDVNAKDDYHGSTPLHQACGMKGNHSHRAIVQLLANPGIEKNAKDNYGQTPILMAAGTCNKEALKLMLASPNVDLDVKNNQGMGLEELVGIYGDSETYTNEEKKTCLDIIQEGRKNLKRGKGIKPNCARASCGNQGRHRCSRCKAVYYCNEDCLSEDWSHHKVHCDYVYKANKVPNGSSN